MSENLSSNLLSETFLEQRRNLTPRNKGPLADIVRYRSYIRWDATKKRRETWLECVARNVEYSLSLYQGPTSRDLLVKEAELMFDRIYNMEVFPSGRSLLVANTDAVRKYPESAFNCCFLVINRLEAFSEIFHLLMCGCGVGYRIQKEDVVELPLLNSYLDIYHEQYKPSHPAARKDETVLTQIGDDFYRIVVGDSKQGWVQALSNLMMLLRQTTGRAVSVSFNYDYVRPSGERLKTFGGRAAGPEGLQKMFTNILEVVKRSSGILSPIDCMDIANYIADNVLVGGTRRAAQIALGDMEDNQFLDAKKDLYDENFKLNTSVSHRRMSNNSVVFNRDPEFSEIEDLFERIFINGEPGFFNLKAAKTRRPMVDGVNPCAEILLGDCGVCNLSTVVWTSHIKDGILDVDKLEESVRLATRIGLRQTNVTITLPNWDLVQKRDRLIGVSMTGFMDACDILGDDFQVLPVLKRMRWAANDEADKYSFEMRVPRPLLVTAVKPEGTLSLLPTVSQGLHRSYAPYYLRRISVSRLDPVAKTLLELNVPYEVKEGAEDRLLFIFPISSGAKISALEESAKDQFQRYLDFQRHYTDHNTSCTLSVAEEERQQLINDLYDNFPDIIACTFVKKVDGYGYRQAPYQQITEEEFYEWKLKSPSPERMETFIDLINKYEVEDEIEEQNKQNRMEQESNTDCSTGACPIV